MDEVEDEELHCDGVEWRDGEEDRAILSAIRERERK
jgi:hypothetical protein